MALPSFVPQPSILFGTVMHHRLLPIKKGFVYRAYYLSVPLDKISTLPVAVNRWAPISFYEHDHGAKDGSNLKEWAYEQLRQHGLPEQEYTITLVCMPRVLGHQYNFFSMWLCYNPKHDLVAVICKVNSYTGGGMHTYVCAHDGVKPITSSDTIVLGKSLVVSPFFPVDGSYHCRFDVVDDRFAVGVDYYTPEGEKYLLTSFVAKPAPMNKQNLRRAFFWYPLLTLRALYLSYLQIIPLWCKKMNPYNNNR